MAKLKNKNLAGTYSFKMRRTIRIINIIAIALVVFEILAYIGSIGDPPIEGKGINAIAFYIGFNIFLIIALLLFGIAYHLKNKSKRNNQNDLIDSIGKKE